MKVQVEFTKFDAAYAHVVGETCCKKMGGEWDDSISSFSDDQREPPPSIVHADCYPEGAVYDHISINFCPFCGAPIEREMVAP